MVGNLQPFRFSICQSGEFSPGSKYLFATTARKKAQTANKKIFYFGHILLQITPRLQGPTIFPP
jgi:hypothetical protein